MASFDMNNVVAGAIQGGVVGSCLGWYFMRRPSRALRIYVTSFVTFLAVSLGCQLVFRPDLDLEHTAMRAFWLSLVYAAAFGTVMVLVTRRNRRRQADPT